MSLPSDMSKNEKFSAITLHESTSDLTSTVKISPHLSFHHVFPYKIGPNWVNWLGTLHSTEILKADMVLLATLPSSKPGILDDENEKVISTVTKLLYSLFVVGVPGYSRLNLLTGGIIEGEPEVRQVSKMPTFYAVSGERALRVDKSDAEEAGRIFKTLDQIYTVPKGYDALRRGFKIFLKAIAERLHYDRVHQFVRSLEAIILAERGRTQKQFKHRCQTFSIPSSDTYNTLGTLYEFRSRVEHLQDWDELLGGGAQTELEESANYRCRQVEALARHTYRKILTTPSILKHFETPATLEHFWKNCKDDDRIKIWGEQFNLASVPIHPPNPYTL